VPLRAPRCLLAGVVLALAACSAEDLPEPPPADSEPVRLFREAVWEPSEEAYEDALRASEETLEDPQVLPLDDALVFAATSLLRGDLERGLPALEVVSRAQPRRPGALLFQGVFHRLRHRRQEALAAFDACLHALNVANEPEPLRDEVLFLAYLSRGEERYLLHDFAGATADLERARRFRADRATSVHRELVRFLADAHVHTKEFGPAEELLREAIAGDPDFPAHHFQLGMVLANEVRTEEAARCYERCLELAPRDPRPRLKLAEIARRAGNLPRMREQLDVLEREQRESDLGGELAAALGVYHFALGRERATAGDAEGAATHYATAREHLLRAVQLDPLCTRSLTLLVQVAAALGAPEDEIEGYKRRLEELEEVWSTFPAAADPSRTFCAAPLTTRRGGAPGRPS